MSDKNMSVNSRPSLLLEKEIIAKAEVSAVENMKSGRPAAGLVHSSVPTTPTTFGTIVITF
ncbi:hypothetical protein ACDQ55_12475 [Chitinophaga sp. 30R24]|uniref:hypothetical protein n=1 Tax=Chitinophaga sp. 30R24 TaxID=3248838 RepID=UPI003B8F4C80